MSIMSIKVVLSGRIKDKYRAQCLGGSHYASVLRFHTSFVELAWYEGKLSMLVHLCMHRFVEQ